MIALASLAAGARCQVNQEIYSEQDLLAIDSEAQPVAVAVLPPPGFEAASASVLSSLPPGEQHHVQEKLFMSFFIVSIYQIPTKYLCCFPLCFCGELTVVPDGDDAMFQAEVSLARARCRQTAPTASGGCGTVARGRDTRTAPTRR